MVFKPIIGWNRMLKGHVNLVICLRSIYYTFCNIFIQTIPTAQKMKFSIKDFFSKSDQIRRKLLNCSVSF